LAAPGHQLTLIPIDRAVPATCFLAASMSSVLRSGSLVRAISVTCASVIVATTSRPGVWDALSSLAAARRSTGVGGVFVTNVNERSSKTVISTGTIVPRWLSVWALYILQKSMMFTPCGPSAVPTGGAGVALPAGIWIFTMATTCFFPMLSPYSSRAPARLELRDLAELELDRRLAAEDVDQHLEGEL